MTITPEERIFILGLDDIHNLRNAVRRLLETLGTAEAENAALRQHLSRFQLLLAYLRNLFEWQPIKTAPKDGTRVSEVKNCGTCRYEPDWGGGYAQGDLHCRFPWPDDLPDCFTIHPIFRYGKKAHGTWAYESGRIIKDCPAHQPKETP